MRRAIGIGMALMTLWSGAAVAAAMLAEGAAFPAWTLPDQSGKTVSSKDLAGKTYLVWFYPKAQTPGCTAEGRGLRDKIEDFRKRGVEIVGVSFDAPDANKAFVEAEGFPFRLLSDQDRTLAQAVGAADSKDASFAKLREISATFTFPNKWLWGGGSRASLTVAGRELHTWTDYKGPDPEVNANNIATTAVLQDQGLVPPLSRLIATFNVRF